jgi:chorismate-pyruvate lyase
MRQNQKRHQMMSFFNKYWSRRQDLKNHNKPLYFITKVFLIKKNRHKYRQLFSIYSYIY